jgi:hypothetical protein
MMHNYAHAFVAWLIADTKHNLEECKIRIFTWITPANDDPYVNPASP